MQRDATRRNVLNRITKLAGLASLVALAACQTMVPKGPARPGQQEPVNVVATDDSRHRIALLLPLTGENADIGQSIANATQLAMLDIQATNIRITTYDTSAGSVAAARSALADGNRLVLGPLLSENVREAAQVTGPAGVPIISFSNDSSVAKSNVFLMGQLPSQSIARVVSYARGQGLSRFAGLVPDNEYGIRSSSALKSAIAQSGGTLTGIAKYDRNSGSVAAAVGALKNGAPYDAVLIADTGRAAVAAAPILRRDGSKGARFLGTELWNTEGALAGNPSIRGAWFASVSDSLYNQYADKYRARFGKAPFRLSSLGYDAVLLTARIAKDWKVGSPFPVARLIDKDGFIGIDGAFRFLPNGSSERQLEVQEIRTGSFATIDPAPPSFAK